MPEVEIERKVRLSRQDAGKRLITLGTALTQGSKSHVKFDEESISFTVGDELEWEFELEVDGDETELEIELKWSDPPGTEVSGAPARTRTSRRRTRT